MIGEIFPIIGTYFPIYIYMYIYIYMGLSENVGNIPNEIAIFHRDNDH